MLLKCLTVGSCFYRSFLFKLFSIWLHHSVHILLGNLLTLHKHQRILVIRVRSDWVHWVPAWLRLYEHSHPHASAVHLLLHNLVCLEHLSVESWLSNWLDGTTIGCILIISEILVWFCYSNIIKWIKFSFVAFLGTILVYASKWRRTLLIKRIFATLARFLCWHCQVRKSLTYGLFCAWLKPKKRGNGISCVNLTFYLFHVCISIFVLWSWAILVLKRSNII